MERVRIPFCKNLDEQIVDYKMHPEKEAQAWWGWHTSYGVQQVYGVEMVVMLLCPYCRTSSGILTKHTISAGGEVNASILCSGRCNGKWHVWGILEDYALHGGRPQLVPLKQ